MSDAEAVTDVVVVGAGISGLTAARSLVRAGLSVTVLEKGRGVGGRMATRRIGDGRADHGAQFFTVRGEVLQGLIDEAGVPGSDAVVAEWCRGFGEGDGYPRYRGGDGMTRLAKWLATDLDVRTGVTAVDLAEFPARAYLVTAPVPQALAILSFSKLLPPTSLQRRLTEIAYHPVIALMATLDGPAAFPAPGAVQQPEDPIITFAADNQVKGISAVPTITLHGAHGWSSDHWEASDDEVADLLLGAAEPWLGGAQATEVSLQRWRYSGPVEPFPDPFCAFGAEPLVVLAGDAFAGPKVEGAVNSGHAAALTLISQLT